MIQAIFYFLLFGAILAAFLMVPKTWRTKRLGIILLSVLLVFEVFVANFHSYHLWFGGYEKREFELDSPDLSISGGHFDTDADTGKQIFVTTSKTVTVRIRNLDEKVGTVRLNLDLGGETFVPYARVVVSARDVTNAKGLRSGIADREIVYGEARTEYISLDLSGHVYELYLQITLPEEDCSVTLRGVSINESVPFRFSPLRLVLPVLVVLGIYALLTFIRLKQSYEEQTKLFKRIAIVMTAVFLLFGTVIGLMQNAAPNFGAKSGNQITQELVDAFEHGQVSLLAEPSEDLLALDNPYDWSERQTKGVSYKWDHLLFEGKYYSYYGIAPVILLFLPYHLITGCYFPTGFAVWMFGMIGMLFLSLCFMAVVDRFARKVPLNILLASLFILQIGSGVFYNFMRSNFYEIAQASGFMFTCLGFYFLIRADLVTERKIRIPSLVLAASFLSLAVLSRPTLAVYCICALFFIGYGLVKTHTGAGEDKKARTKADILYLVAALVPFVVIGGGQAVYNYVRFGSFLDFGIQYSLTINDFTRSQYHTDLAVIGFYNFLFAPPTFQPKFPFFFSNFSTLNTPGYYYIANRNAIGLFFRGLPIWGLFGAGRLFRQMDKAQRRRLLLLVLPTCVLAPLVIIFSIWESGYGVRYCADFAWQMVGGGMLVLYLLYERSENETSKRGMQYFFVIAAVVALFLNSAMIYDYLDKSGEFLAACRRLERVFNYWL
ncbi:MAG: hypothetical protein IKS35_03075 [Clostridia bacterium]|nr:hypothetical protein [Clostridia bacterium]